MLLNRTVHLKLEFPIKLRKWMNMFLLFLVHLHLAINISTVMVLDIWMLIVQIEDLYPLQKKLKFMRWSLIIMNEDQITYSDHGEVLWHAEVSILCNVEMITCSVDIISLIHIAPHMIKFAVLLLMEGALKIVFLRRWLTI